MLVAAREHEVVRGVVVADGEQAVEAERADAHLTGPARAGA